MTPRRLAGIVLGLGLLLVQGPSPVAAQSTTSTVTLRVISTQPMGSSLDPEASYSSSTIEWELLRCCLSRAVMGFPGLPGYEGSQPVPDLAAAPPTISPDGMTWTFHLRQGLRYAPPFGNAEITSKDVVRAILRAGSADAIAQNIGHAGFLYLPLVEGYAEYSAGKASSVSGLQTPDDHTLLVQETRPDRSLAYVFAMPFTSPIPPSPTDPSAPLGAATGHAWTGKTGGYGPFLVATGPYMFEGSEALDFSLPPDQQQPVAGYADAGWNETSTVTFVRNPSWSRSSDPLRPAIPDRIEISVIPDGDPYEALDAGGTDLVVGDNPPSEVIDRYTVDAGLRDHIATTPLGATFYGTINIAQPPFDDVHVRRALSLMLDPATLMRLFGLTGPGSAVTHLVPDPLDDDLLASWDPFGGSITDRLRAARAEMDASRYGDRGACAGPCSVSVEIPRLGDMGKAKAYFRKTLAKLGVTSHLNVKPYSCYDPAEHVAVCALVGWGVDYPSAGNMFVPEIGFLNNEQGLTLLGSSPAQLRRWGYSARTVPSIDGDYARCASIGGTAASLCWARLDQLLVTGLAAIFPVKTPNATRVSGANVTSFPIDQAFAEVSLDRVQLGG
jgi:peptide/nickel transport system substrate-binding protein